MPADPLTQLRLTGFAGATLLAAGAVVAGALPRRGAVLPAAAALRPTVVAGIALVVVGTALLVTAWWRAGRQAPPVRWTRVTAALWAVPLLCAPPLFSRDVYAYAAQGDLLAHGLDPYAVGPAALPSAWLSAVSPTWWDTPAPYGPLFLVLARAAAALAGGHLVVAVLVLRLVAVAGVVLLALAVPPLARRCGVDERSATWLTLASPLLLLHAVSGAHNDALLVGLLAAGLACAVRGQGARAAALVALAAAVKAPALVALPFLVLLWPCSSDGRSSPGVRHARWRAAVLTAAVAGAVFAAVTAASGLGFGWLTALRTPGDSVQWTSVPTGVGLAAGWLTGAPGTALTVARTAGTVLTAVVLAGLWWRAHRRGDPRSVVAALGWGLAAVVVLAPAFHPWYALWALVPLAASTVDARVRTGLAVATGVLCFLVLPDGYNLARATVVPGVLLDIGITVTAAALAVVPAVRRWRGSRVPVEAGT